MRTLTLELADEQVEALEREAQRLGMTINEVVAELLSSLPAQVEFDVTKDPIYNIESYDTGAPSDLSQNADHYLYGVKKR